jgi:hypothetical protein
LAWPGADWSARTLPDVRRIAGGALIRLRRQAAGDALAPEFRLLS